MGYASYSVNSRTTRAVTEGYHTKSVDDIFQQNKLRQIHESMSPIGLKIRECCDSEAHPLTIPIILALDDTGSMRRIPHDLIKDGLPKLMGSLIQKGATDASLMFMAVGDHECDHYPLQIGQFESGDEELDMWLTRTYLEGGGGGNSGESYLIPWYVASRHTKIDSFTKRGKKGLLFTVGDEECLRKLPASEITRIFGDPAQKSLSDKELLEEASKMYDVFHIHILHSDQAKREYGYWKELLGQNCIGIEDYTKVPEVICETVLSTMSKPSTASAPSVSKPKESL